MMAPAEYQQYRAEFVALIKERFELDKIYTHQEALALLADQSNPSDMIRTAIARHDLLLTIDWCVVRRADNAT